MHTFGYTVYLARLRDQNRFLAEGLRPLLTELLAQSEVSHFWFDRSDVRGPHVRVTIGCEQRQTRDRLTAETGRWLRDSGPYDRLSDREIATRHQACQGRVFCAADSLPGLASLGTYEEFEQPLNAYPLGRVDDFSDISSLRREMTRLAAWTLNRVDDRPAWWALRWLALFDQAITSQSADPQSFWLACAQADLPALSSTPRRHDLERWIGEKNLLRLRAVWELRSSEKVAGLPDPSPWIEACRGSENVEGKAQPLIRELMHCVLKQLAVPVAVQIPMILFALHQHLPTDPPVESL